MQSFTKHKDFILQKLKTTNFSGGIAKFLKTEEQQLIKTYSLENNDIIFFTANKKWEAACKAMGQIRIKIANDLGIIDEINLNFYGSTTSHYLNMMKIQKPIRQLTTCSRFLKSDILPV